MPVTNAHLLADDLVARWIVENSPVKIPFYDAWFWQRVAGKSLIYPRTTTVAPASIVDDCATVAETEPTLSQAEFEFWEHVARYSICAVDLDRFQHPNNLDTALYALAKIEILYAYAKRIVDIGPAGTLHTLADPARIVDMSAGALTLDCLDDAYERVDAGRPTLIMSSKRSLRTYRKLCRDAGFKPERVHWKRYDPAKRRMVDDTVDAFNGTPWLVNDFVNPAHPGGERTYFMLMGDDDGPGHTRGVSGIMPQAQHGNPFNKRIVQGILDPIGGGPGIPTMNPGIDVWVTMPAGLALGSQGALSIIENYATVSDCGGDL